MSRFPHSRHIPEPSEPEVLHKLRWASENFDMSVSINPREAELLLELLNGRKGVNEMPGKGSRFTGKEDRQAKHIADSEQKENPGMSREKAESIGYAHENKEKHGGGKGKK